VTETNQVFRIFVIDDDRSVRTSLARLMRVSGFKVEAFDTPELFLERVTVDWIGCVLLDMSLPHVPGLQVQARLKERGIDLPVIAMSARDDEHVRETARELGARFFLRKPIDDHALLDAISWVSGAGAKRTRAP